MSIEDKNRNGIDDHWESFGTPPKRNWKEFLRSRRSSPTRIKVYNIIISSLLLISAIITLVNLSMYSAFTIGYDFRRTLYFAVCMIPVNLAARKGYSYWIFYVFALIAPLFALICAYLIMDWTDHK